jgi:predicted DsbA family dithiol-disulfide isomerase
LLAGRPVDFKVIASKYANLAKELGLPFAQADRVYDSRPAHEISVWAHANQKITAWHNAVFHAYYALGRNISSATVLADLAASIGLPQATALEALDAGTYKKAVDHDWSLAHRHDIIAAPTILLSDARLVGAQPYEKLQQFVESNGALKK